MIEEEGIAIPQTEKRKKNNPKMGGGRHKKK